VATRHESRQPPRLIRLVNGCTKPESQPFKAWVSEVIATLQRDGTYTLDPAPVQPAPHGGTAYLMPEQVADAIIRLEERNIRADEALAVAQVERIEEMRRTNDHLGHTNDHLAVLSDRVGGVHHVLGRIADTLDLIADRTRPATPAPPPPTITPPAAPRHLAGEEPGRHRGRARRRRLPRPGAGAWAGALPAGGGRGAYGAHARPGP